MGTLLLFLLFYFLENSHVSELLNLSVYTSVEENKFKFFILFLCIIKIISALTDYLSLELPKQVKSFLNF